MATSESPEQPRDFVLDRIDSIRRSATFWRMGWGYLWTVLLVVGLVFLGVLLDHLFVLQRGARMAFLQAFLFACGGGLLAATLYPVLRNLGRLYVARRIEQREPELGNALISYLQVRRDPRVPTEVKRLLARKAQGHVRSADTGVAVDFSPFVRMVAVVSAVIIIFVVYAVFSPKSTPVSMARLFRPKADILPPTATRLTNIEPGDMYVIEGDRPTLEVRVDGARPASVYAVWDGQSFQGRTLLLSSSESGLWRTVFPPVLEDGGYTVRAGDTRSERLAIEVLPEPIVEKLRLQVRPPEYTGLPTGTVTDGDVQAVKGSRVTVQVSTNLPPGRGALEFGSGLRVVLDAAPDAAQLTGQFTVLRSDTYQVRFQTQPYPGGKTFQNRNPLQFTLTCLEDRAPQVQLHGPADGLAVSPEDTVPLEYTASDDFGLDRVVLRSSVWGVSRSPLTVAENPGRRQEAAEFNWHLAELDLTAGQVVTYYLEAVDRHQPDAQTGRSETRRLVVRRDEDLMEAPEPEEGQQPQETPPGQEPHAAEESVSDEADEARRAEEVVRRIRDMLRERGDATEASSPPDERTQESEAQEGRPGDERAPGEPRQQGLEGEGPDRGLAGDRERGDRQVAGTESRADGRREGAGEAEGAQRAGSQDGQGEAGSEEGSEPRHEGTQDTGAPESREAGQRQGREGGQRDEGDRAGGGADSAGAETQQERAGREGSRGAEGTPEGSDGGGRPGERDQRSGSTGEPGAGADGPAEAEGSADRGRERPEGGTGGRPGQGEGQGEAASGAQEQGQQPAAEGTGDGRAQPEDRGAGGASGTGEESPDEKSTGSGEGPGQRGADPERRSERGDGGAGTSGGRAADSAGQGQRPEAADRERGAGSPGAAGEGGLPGQGQQAAEPGQGADGSAGSRGEAAGAESGSAEGGTATRQDAGGTGGDAGRGSSTGADRGSSGATQSGRADRGGSSGDGVARLPAEGAPEDELPEGDLEPILDEVEGMLEEDRIPPKFLEDLSLDREGLRELIQELRKRKRDAAERDAEEQKPQQIDEQARVLSGADAVSSTVRLADGLPEEVTPDDLRSRFEGARQRLSERYRDIVGQYYKALSEEE